MAMMSVQTTMTRRMTDHINTVLYNQYWLSSQAILAHTTIFGELMKYNLVCDHTQRAPWRQFISNVLLELLIYGYCVYKLVGKIPAVLPGRYVELQRMPGMKWKIKIFDQSCEHLRGSAGWMLYVADEPIIDDYGMYGHPTSPFYRALPEVLKLRMLENNMLSRDKFNSEPAIYTKISNEIGSNPATTRPWFRQAHSSMIPAQVTQRVDFNTLVRHRETTIEELRKITETARARDNISNLGEIPQPVKRAHREHMVTDGRDLKEVRHLQQDNEMVHHVMERTSFLILQILGVPPQALGHNINSERLASSNRLTEMSIQHFDTYIKEFKILIEIILKQLPGSPTFGDCVTLHTINVVQDVVKAEKLADMYACVFDALKPEDFDLELIKLNRHQDTDERKQREVPTEEEKDENAKKKAKAN